jgi:molybdate transport system permease protein
MLEFFLDDSTLSAIGLSLQLASSTTLVLLVLATPLAWWLSRGATWLRSCVSSVVAMPIVLPPSVLGFYLLVSFGPQGPIGHLTQLMGLQGLNFTFAGLLIGSVIYSLPFAVQPLQNAFEAIGTRPLEVAATLRASPLDTFIHVVLPLSKPGYLTAGVLVFAHTVGEFGVVLMLGGNIPGKTQVLSTKIYGHVEALEYAQAHWLAAMMLAFSFFCLLALAGLRRQARTARV